VTTYTFSGFLMTWTDTNNDGNDDTVTFGTTKFQIVAADAQDKFSYEIDFINTNTNGDEGDLPQVIISGLNAYSMRLNGQFFDGQNTGSSIGEIKYSAGKVTQLMSFGDNGVNHIFSIGGDAFPLLTSAAQLQDLEASATYFGEVTTAGLLAGDLIVTHIARQDALAFCQWSGARLPTEAEWEYASRGGLAHQPFPWGIELEPDGVHRCNVWQGNFPTYNSLADGYDSTAPVTAYKPNGLGFYNMTGNVWEWMADRFTTLHPPRHTCNPKGPLNGSAFVAKGGSYLCHASYCARYRTSSRQSLSADTTTGNLGFRVALTEGEICGRFRCQPVVFEPNIIAHRVGWFPAEAEGRVGHYGVEFRFFGGIYLAQHIPVIGQSVAMVNFELSILHPM
jgi:hypothetical protein